VDAGAVGEAVGEAVEAQVDVGEGDSKGDMGVVRLREPSFRSDPSTTGAVGARLKLPDSHCWALVPVHEAGRIEVARCPCLTVVGHDILGDSDRSARTVSVAQRTSSLSLINSSIYYLKALNLDKSFYSTHIETNKRAMACCTACTPNGV
jgi:hypothetical protein